MNDTDVERSETKDLSAFLKELYKGMNPDYTKFYKMDNLSKLAFIGVEYMKKHYPGLDDYSNDLALIFSGSDASYDTDRDFMESYANGGIPSPSLFVYTLPSIQMGELAIRSKWQGEQIYTVLPEFDSEHYIRFCKTMLQEKANACLCAWINVNGENYEAFLFLVEKSRGKELNLPLNSESLLSIFKQKS